MYKISVIIPIYNSRDLLNECLYSVVNQSIGIENIQVICVNDRSASTDQELELQYYWKEQYPDNFLILVNTERLGLGPSRNKGTLYVKGVYVHFVDADDVLLPNLYLDAYQNLQKHQARLFRFNYYRDPNNPAQKEPGLIYKERIMTASDKTRALFYSFAWRNIFDARLLKMMGPFPNTFYEDMPTIPSLYKAVGIFLQTNKIYYYYRKTPNSLSVQVSSDMRARDGIKIGYLEKVLRDFVEHEYFAINYENMIAQFFLMYMFSFVNDSLTHFKSTMKLLKDWKLSSRKPVRVRLSGDMLKDFSLPVIFLNRIFLFFWSLGFYELLFFFHKMIVWVRKFSTKM